MRWASNPPRKTALATETLTNLENHHTLGEELRTEATTPRMRSGDEIREEVSAQKESLGTPKQLVRVAAWNVRTMYETGRTAQIVKEMERYSVSILGVSEMRWTDTGLTTGFKS